MLLVEFEVEGKTVEAYTKATENECYPAYEILRSLAGKEVSKQYWLDIKEQFSAFPINYNFKSQEELTVAQIKEKLANNDKWAIRGLLAIFEKQTEDEKRDKQTKHSNGVGFNGVDAEFCTSLANFYNRTGFLTPKQISALFKIMPKYARQLHDIAYS